MDSCGKRGSLPVAGGANMVPAPQPLAAASISDDMKMADFTVSSGRFIASMIRKKPAPHLMRGGNRFSEKDHAQTYGRSAMTTSIVGWAHTPFGKFDTETVESLVVKVANEALADAGITAADVDEIVLGHFNAGFSPQDFTAALVLQADPNLRFKPATRVENACATGSAAVHQGIRAIAAGAAKIVLVVGVE